MVTLQAHRKYSRVTIWGMALVWALLYVYASQAASQGAETPVKNYIPSHDDVVIGRKEAPVTVVEFSSFTCLHCADFHQKVYKKIYETYIAPGLVGYVMVPFPMDAIALRASQLAGACGLASYPRMADLIFSKQKEWLFSKNPFESLEALILKAGVDTQDIKNALKNKDFLKGMLQNCLRAHKEFQINKTPSFMINGHLVEGGLTFEAFEALIKTELDAALIRAT